MIIYYNDDYVASPEQFDTTRKSALIAERVRRSVGLVLTDPSVTIPRHEVERIVAELHPIDYLNALRTGEPRALAESSALQWGPDTYDFALAHSHGVGAAIAAVLEGEKRAGTLSSGLHHARPDMGSGYCTLNGLAVGVAFALARGRRVLILDFDAHFGGGTFSHLAKLNARYGMEHGERPMAIQVDVSVSQFDGYVGFPPHYQGFVAGGDAADKRYLGAITDALNHAESRVTSDTLIIYNAGVDPVNSCRFDDPFGTMGTRDTMVSEWVGDMPAIFTLAGGYTNGFTADDIADLHLATITAWARGS